MNFPLDAQHDSLENVLRCVQTYRRYCNSNSLLSFEMVLLVASRGPTVPVQIAKALSRSEASTSVGLDHLGTGSPKFGRTLGEPPDLLTKISHPVDARMKLAALTQRGNQLAAEMRASLKYPLY